MYALPEEFLSFSLIKFSDNVFNRPLDTRDDNCKSELLK